MGLNLAKLIAKRGSLLRKFAGDRTGILSSGSESRVVMGRQLRVASTCESAVASSSNVNFRLPIIFARARFISRMPASHNPP